MLFRVVELDRLAGNEMGCRGHLISYKHQLLGPLGLTVGMSSLVFLDHCEFGLYETHCRKDRYRGPNFFEKSSDTTS